MKTYRTFCAPFVALAFWRLALGIIVSLAAASAVHAMNKTWTSAISSNFTGPGNWNPSGAPGATDQATFSAAGTYTMTFNNSPNPLPNPVLNQDLFFSAGNATFTSGTGGPFTYRLTGGGSDANITGGTLTLGIGINPLNLTVDDDLVVRGGATLNVNSGSVVNTLDLVLAQAASGGSGTINVDGSGSALNVTDSTTQSLGLNGNPATLTFRNTSSGSISGPLDIGASSSGSLNVQSGANLSVASLSVGSGTGTGAVNVTGTGSTLVQSGVVTLTVGAASGGSSAINIGTSATGGTLTTGSGLFTINKTGTVSVGSATTAGTLNANGNVTIDGGSLQVPKLDSFLNPGSNFLLAAGKTFTVQNGGQATFGTTGTYTTAANANYNITGMNSKLESNLLTIENGAQVNVSSGGVLQSTIGVSVDGGVLQLASPSSDLVPQVVWVRNGGRATLDLGGSNYSESYVASGVYVTGTNSKWELVNGSGLIVTSNVQLDVDLGGSLLVAGDIHINQLGTLIIDSGSTVTANAIFLDDLDRSVLDFSGGTLGITGAAGLTLGRSNLGANVSLRPDHTLNVTNTTTLTVGNSLALEGGTFNTGSLVINGGAFDFNSGTLGITDPAGLTVGMGGLFGATAVFNANQAIHITNTITVNSGAYLGAAGGFSAGHLINNGDFVVINTAVDGPVVNNHAVTVVGNVNFNGLVSGPGGFFGPGTAHFNGGLAPGASPADVSFEGNLALADTNTLFIEIGGTTPGSQYDRLTIAGSATLDGFLNLSLINGFTPTGGQQFTILTAGSIVNNGFALTGSAASSFNLLVNSTSVILQAIGLPGDYNQNGVVDAADFAVWRKGLGTIYTQNDYNVWRTNFGQPGGSGSGAIANVAVPEPATLVLLIPALAGWCLRRRRAA